ncbi:MAG: hypothetical protein J6O04_06545 [Selenomonadaceae bacterium]|nr:hypothetical protein [Selenomonadaceae bacterium]
MKLQKTVMLAQNDYKEDKASRALGVNVKICPQSHHKDERPSYDLRHNENPIDNHNRITFPYNARITSFFEVFLSIFLG